MKKGLLISGLIILGFVIYFGVLASSEYRDPIGVGLLMFWTFLAGIFIGGALTEDGNDK